MPVVTIAGRQGSPIKKIGLEVARSLGADYVDNQIIAQAARRSGAPIQEIAQKDERAIKGRERLAQFFQNFLEKSAAAGSAGDPFLGPTGIEVLMSRTMAEAAEPSHNQRERLNDERYIEAITSVIEDEALTGNVVMIGRGSNVILHDLPNSLHVYVVASLESRVAEIMQRERLSEADAHKYVQDFEESRVKWYKKFFKVNTEEPDLYHLFLNADRLGIAHTARIVVDSAEEVQRQLVEA